MKRLNVGDRVREVDGNAVGIIVHIMREADLIVVNWPPSHRRKPYDTILKFKILVLQSLHNLSDDRTEYLIRDRISFMRFLDLELEDPVPDATTIWLFREALAQAGLIDKLFERFGQHLEAEGYIARGGQIIDATIVSVPRQRNTKEENETIKAGKTPEGWEQQPA